MTLPTVAVLAAILVSSATLSVTSSERWDASRSAHELTIPHNSDFNRFLPETHASYSEELRQHTDRLRTIEGLLRARDVSDLPEALRAERVRTIEHLHEYWTRAEYPTGPAAAGPRRPCFIDARGRICAVGYLIERSVGRDEAERINARWNPNTIREINDPALARWIASSGLSYDEVVAIQRPMLDAPGSVRPAFSGLDTDHKRLTIMESESRRLLSTVANSGMGNAQVAPSVSDTASVAQSSASAQPTAASRLQPSIRLMRN